MSACDCKLADVPLEQLAEAWREHLRHDDELREHIRQHQQNWEIFERLIGAKVSQ